MNDPLVLVLFLATWGGIVLLFRRLADDFKKVSVGQSVRTVEQPDEVSEAEQARRDAEAASADELRLLAGEFERTASEMTEALTRRADRLKELMEQADNTVARLTAATQFASRPVPHAAVPAAPMTPGALAPAAPQVEMAAPASIPASVSPPVTLVTPGASGAAAQSPVATPASEPVYARPAEPQVVLPPGQRGAASDIVRLAGQGYDPDTIARMTNRGREEVRLVLQRSGTTSANATNTSTTTSAGGAGADQGSSHPGAAQ
jgi:hypothetical protein